jgi:hypothetical protein
MVPCSFSNQNLKNDGPSVGDVQLAHFVDWAYKFRIGKMKVRSKFYFEN